MRQKEEGATNVSIPLNAPYSVQPLILATELFYWLNRPHTTQAAPPSILSDTLVSLQEMFDGWKIDWPSESSWEKEYDRLKNGIYQGGHSATIRSFWHNLRNHIEEGRLIIERVREHVDQLCRVVGGEELKVEILELYDMSIATALEVKFFEGKLVQYKNSLDD